jgi:hypothetical protein
MQKENVALAEFALKEPICRFCLLGISFLVSERGQTACEALAKLRPLSILQSKLPSFEGPAL